MLKLLTENKFMIYIFHVIGVLYDYPTRKLVILKCNINDSSFVISQVHISNKLIISMIVWISVTVCNVESVTGRDNVTRFSRQIFLPNKLVSPQSLVLGL
jgi:hypothetical protein